MKGGKPDLAILIGKPKGGPAEDDMDEEMDGEDEGGSDLEMAAQDLIDAIADKDAVAVAAALQAAFDCCSSGPPEEEADEEE